MTYFGTAAPFIYACMKAGVEPGRDFDTSRIKSLGSTGSPLSPEGFEWVYDKVGGDLLLGSFSGGTDLCTGFVGSCDLLPVYAGEIQCRCLGASVEAFDAGGQPVVDEVGELVITRPMPSMPIYFWNDVGRRRYHESYFGLFPGIWRHGDWVKVTGRGTCVIYGRSDSTLNRGGVRMGTSEFYRVVEGMDEVVDSLVVDTGGIEGGGRLLLFVVLREGVELDDGLALGDHAAPALPALAPPRAERYLQHRLGPQDAERQEAGGAGEEDPVRRTSVRCHQHGRDEQSGVTGLLHGAGGGGPVAWTALDGMPATKPAPTV